MPVRSLGSSVLKWPDRKKVIQQAGDWADKTGYDDKNIVGIKCFGSIVSDDRWGVGSDIDILIILKSSDKDFMKRCLDYNVSEIDVPADILVYTEDEITLLAAENSRFYHEIINNSHVLYPSPEGRGVGVRG